MIENNAEGKLTGYKAGKIIKLVRNPNWDPRHGLPPGVPRRDLHPDERDRRQRVGARRSSTARA